MTGLDLHHDVDPAQDARSRHPRLYIAAEVLLLIMLAALIYGLVRSV